MDFYFAVNYTIDMAKNEKKQKNNSTGLAIAIWIFIFLVLLIVFLVKQDEIFSNLKTTQFFERLFGATPEFIQKHEVKEKESYQNESETVIKLHTPNQNSVLPYSSAPAEEKVVPLVPAEDGNIRNEATEKTEASNSIQNQTENRSQSQIQGKNQNPAQLQSNEGISQNFSTSEKNVQGENPPTSAKTENPVNPATTEAKKEPSVTKEKNMTSQKLYFVYIGEDGTLSRKMIVRSVEKNDSPLVTNINLLLAGPNPQESSKGYRSLIPQGTRLLSASVRDGVAYLNFNEQFEFNTVGADGYQAQLMQIVYTATEFSTVNSVQFLIEGQKREYLGSEGRWIGSPLARSSFN